VRSSIWSARIPRDFLEPIDEAAVARPHPGTDPPVRITVVGHPGGEDPRALGRRRPAIVM